MPLPDARNSLRRDTLNTNQPTSQASGSHIPKLLLKSKWLRLILGLVVGGGYSFFVLKAVNFQLNELRTIQFTFSQINIGWLIVSLVFITTSLIVSASSWVWIINVLGSNVPYSFGIKVFFLSQFGRYVPGKIWTFVGRFIVHERKLASKAHISESIVYEQAMSFLVAAGIAGLTFALSRNIIEWKISGLSYIILGVVVLSLLAPSLFRYIMNRLLVFMGKEAVQSNINMYHLGIYFLINLLLWVLMGYGIYFLARSIFSIPFEQSIFFPAVFCISWLGGLLSFLTPSGIGVREGILIYLLSQFIMPSQAVLLAVGARIWLTFAEFICLGLALAISSLSPLKESNA